MKEDHFEAGAIRPDPHLLRSLNVVIVGLGLMGGSIALALRGRCASVWGIDPDSKTLETAGKNRVVDQAVATPSQLLPDADLIILAAPISAILLILGELPRLHPGPAIVIDIGSTKREIIASMQNLPQRFDPIGGHPICGKEKNSLEYASADLFQDAPFVLTNLERTSSKARNCALALVAALGCKPLWMEPEQHDEWIAATSHLPYLTACALSLATPLAAAELVGPGFRSSSRLAASSPAMMLDILKTNRQNLLSALQHYREQLDRLETNLRQNNWVELENLLSASAAARRALVDFPQREGIP